MFTANWSYPTAVRFGAGRISELADACASAGIKKPLLVTDKGLVNLPFVQKITADLEANGLAAVVFADVDPNPTGENLDAGLEVFRDGGHDGVVCVDVNKVSWVGDAGATANLFLRTLATQDQAGIIDFFTRAGVVRSGGRQQSGSQ